jgi:hypothetical protein
VNKKRDDKWKPIFDSHNRWCATAVSRTVGCWEVIVGRRSVGVVANPTAAKELIDRVNGGGDGGES